MKREPKMHFGGGLRTPTTEWAPGWPCCCDGSAAIRANKQGRTTFNAGDVTCYRCLEQIDRAIGGPIKCPRECSECVHPKDPRAGFFDLHHFSDNVRTIDDDPDHPAVTTLGLTAWFVCKHCDAWAADVYAHVNVNEQVGAGPAAAARKGLAR